MLSGYFRYPYSTTGNCMRYQGMIDIRVLLVMYLVYAGYTVNLVYSEYTVYSVYSEYTVYSV